MSELLTPEQLAQIRRCISPDGDCPKNCSWSNNGCTWEAALLAHIEVLNAKCEQLRGALETIVSGTLAIASPVLAKETR